MPLTKKDKKKLIDYCKEQKIDHKTGWSNFTGSVTLPEAVVLDIQSEAQAVALAKFINKLNYRKEASDIITYRAIAAGENKAKPDDRYDRQSYSMTLCMEADILLHLSGPSFHRIQWSNREKLQVEVGPSIQMGDLDQRLYDDFKCVLPTSTLIPWVTIGGSATGTHGTGRDQPSIPGLINSMRILRPDGEVILLDDQHTDFETIRGAHLGLFGIVLSMEVQCRPAMKLEITTQTTNVYGYKELIKKGLYRDNEYVSVAYFADGEKDEGAKNASKDLIVMTWKPVPLNTPDQGNCSQLEYMGQRFTIFVQENLHINELLKLYPHLVPLFKKYIVAPAVTAGQNKKIVVPWPDGAHYQRAFPHDLDDEDDIFPVSDDCHELLDALDQMVIALDKHTAKGLNPALYAMYFRYFKGTNGGLSTSAHSENQHVVGFDMTSARDMPGFAEFKNDVRTYLMKKYNAKPHHGKTVPSNISYEAIYNKDYHAFKRALAGWMNACNLSIERNPHLNAFFRHHLEIGALEQRVEAAIAIQQRDRVSYSSKQELILNVLDFFHENDEQFHEEETALILRKKLQELMKTAASNPSTNSSTLFYPDKPAKQEEELEVVTEDNKTTKNCCVLL